VKTIQRISYLTAISEKNHHKLRDLLAQLYNELVTLIPPVQD